MFDNLAEENGYWNAEADYDSNEYESEQESIRNINAIQEDHDEV